MKVKFGPALFLLLAAVHAFSQGVKPVLLLVDEQVISNDAKYKGTAIGGLSGIDYISGNTFCLISDDPGVHGPPRFYKATIEYTSQGITEINFIAMKEIACEPGKYFLKPSQKPVSDQYLYSDGETIRWDKNTRSFFWTSEGFHSSGILAQPFIYNTDSNGAFRYKIPPIPRTFLTNPKKKDRGIMRFLNLSPWFPALTLSFTVPRKFCCMTSIRKKQIYSPFAWLLQTKNQVKSVPSTSICLVLCPKATQTEL